ncbi:hypothetical protein SSPIM334S_03365 [Streptomyces spiroverticillatus]
MASAPRVISGGCGRAYVRPAKSQEIVHAAHPSGAGPKSVPAAASPVRPRPGGRRHGPGPCRPAVGICCRLERVASLRHPVPDGRRRRPDLAGLLPVHPGRTDPADPAVAVRRRDGRDRQRRPGRIRTPPGALGARWRQGGTQHTDRSGARRTGTGRVDVRSRAPSGVGGHLHGPRLPHLRRLPGALQRRHGRQPEVGVHPGRRGGGSTAPPRRGDRTPGGRAVSDPRRVRGAERGRDGGAVCVGGRSGHSVWAEVGGGGRPGADR